MFHHFNVNNVPELNPSFKLAEKGFNNGLDVLDQNLTINSITVTPDYVYRGQDAYSSGWTALIGDTLTLSGSGSDPTLSQPTPFLNTEDKAVLINGGKYYLADDTSFGDVDGEDFVFEAVFVKSTSANLTILSKRDSGTNPGYRFRVSGGLGSVVNMGIGDATSEVFVSAGSTLLPYTWNHVMVFADKDGSAVLYLNGEAGPDLSIASLGSLSNAVALNIGSIVGLAQYDEHIAYAALWKRDSWLDTHLQVDIAQDRFYKLAGLKAQKAPDSASLLPSECSRDTMAYNYTEDSGTRYMHNITENWARASQISDPAGEVHSGILVESESENLLLQSYAFSAPWSVIDTGDSVAASVASPAYPSSDPAHTSSVLTTDATVGPHGITQQVSLTADRHTFSIWAKAANLSWVYMANQNVLGADGYFNLSTASLGTMGVGADGIVEDWGNGWVRCGIAFDAVSGTNTMIFQLADSDGDATISGSGDDVYFWGAQLEIGDTMSSYIQTTTTSVTRGKDVLNYNIYDHLVAVSGHLSASIVGPNASLTKNTAIMAMSDKSFRNGLFMSYAGVETDQIHLDLNTDFADGYNDGYEVDAYGSSGVVLTDGYKHSILLDWEDNNINLYIDDQLEVNESLATLPVIFSTIELGSFSSIVSVPTLISDIAVVQDPAARYAFENAEGFGRYAVGGRGGDIYRVTNLDDDGAGSLRYGIENQTGPRTIVFDVSGYIDLASELQVTQSYLSILGQTAPGKGITLTGRGGTSANKVRRFTVIADHVIVRYLRFRLGDTWQDSAIQSSGQAVLLSNTNVMFDHCVASWFWDDFTIFSQDAGTAPIADLITVSNCIIAEPWVWWQEGHGGKAILVDVTATNDTSRITFAGNLVAHAHSRYPQLTNDGDSDFYVDWVNNVVYGQGRNLSHNGLAASPDHRLNFNWINNVNKAADGYTGLYDEENVHITCLVGWPHTAYGFTNAKLYHSGNTVLNFDIESTSTSDANFGGEWEFQAEPFDTYPVNDVEDTFAYVLANAGMGLNRRDSREEYVITNAEDGYGDLVDVIPDYPILT